MSATEQASLRSLQSLDESPSPEVWERICLEWERGSLSEPLGSVQERPGHSHWDQIKTNLPTRGSQRVFAKAALSILAIGGFVALYLTTSKKIQIESNAVATLADNKIQNSQPLPSPTIGPAPRGTNETVSLIDRKAKKNNPVQEDDYLWLASRSGDPIRIHNRWQDLSCCLSGETQAADCHTQKQQWHQEIDASDLGFQADPFLGLIELLETAENPPGFSPNLRP